jgi:nucleoside-diphosphate-sugar epimerase
MRVFVTGASGFVGSAVVRELIANGHHVLGLARSEANATAIQALGGQVHRGDLTDLESLKAGAAQSDGVIHCAFIHDFSNFKASSDVDICAIETMGAVLAGSDRPMIVTSGTGLAQGKVITEETLPPINAPIPRRSEQTAQLLVAKSVRAMTVRLPPTTHGAGDHGFTPRLIGIAREKGSAAYIGDGTNVWAACHRTDAARVYRLALENGDAGARYHAIAEQGIPFRDIAAAIGRHLNLPVVSLTPEQAAAHFTWFAHFAAMGSPASSERTRARLGWKPTQPGLLPDMDANYFTAGATRSKYD